MTEIGHDFPHVSATMKALQPGDQLGNGLEVCGPQQKQKWVDVGKRSMNKSGCACLVAEDGETVEQPCAAHAAWLRAAMEQGE